MAALTTRNIVDAGTPPTFTTLTEVTNTFEIGNGRNTFIVFRNTDASSRTVTITVSGTNEYGQNNPDPVHTLNATNGEAWVPIRKQFDDPNTPGRGTFTVSAFANVSVAVVKVS